LGGRRRFSPGSDQEWEQALSRPGVQQALSDPGVQQALAHSLPGGPPQQLADGGPVSSNPVVDENDEAFIDTMQIPDDQKQRLRLMLKQRPPSNPGAAATTAAGTTGSTGMTTGTPPATNSVAPLMKLLGMNSGSQIGPPTAMNTIIPAALAGAVGASSGRGNNAGAAMVGMGTAALLNYLIRKHAQSKPTVQGATPPGISPDLQDRTVSQSDVEDAKQKMANLDSASPPYMRRGPVLSPMEDLGPQPGPDMPLGASGYGLPTPQYEPPSDYATQSPDYVMQDEPDEPMAEGGKVKKRKFAAGGEMAEPVVKKPMGRAVLVRRPRPVPVVSTTIVLKKKPDKKKKGGPLKAEALPPKRGPEPQGPPAPFKKGGHVQVPRGFGAAERGKRFGGIY